MSDTENNLSTQRIVEKSLGGTIEKISCSNNQSSSQMVNPGDADICTPDDTELRQAKKRLFYLDFVRALSVFLIVLTHFNNPFFSSGGWLITNYPFNIYVGALGVSLFLMISGTALTVTYHRPLNIRTFYKKRFLGIYPMFWIAWVVGTLVIFLLQGGVPLNGAPLKYFPLTLFAMDGMAANFGIPTMYLLGEWFLGFIVIFYIVFPLLLWGVQEHPWATGTVSLAIYIGSQLLFTAADFYIPTAILLPTRLPELLFGMYFATYWKRVSPWALIPATAVLMTSVFLPWIPEDIAVTFVGISAFVVLVFLGEHLEYGIVKVPIDLVSKYSYAIFLVHHVIIIELFKYIPIVELKFSYRVLAFLSVLFLSYALGVALYHFHKVFMDYVYRALEKTA